MSGKSDDKSSVEYIQHHLTNLCYGDCKTPNEAGGFWALHIDTLFFSLLLGAILVFFARHIGQRVHSGAPSGLVNATEMLVEFVNKQISDTFTVRNPLIGPLALTIFTWVLLMNAMDLVPVDLLPEIAFLIGVDYLKVVPTTDLNATLGLSLSVFALIIFYNIKHKGAVGYLKMFLFHPFGKYFVPINIVMTLIEELAKPLSLGLRLFGNLFAGELVFSADCADRRHPGSRSGGGFLDTPAGHPGSGLADFSPASCYTAGFYIYGFDDRVLKHGTRATLKRKGD